MNRSRTSAAIVAAAWMAVPAFAHGLLVNWKLSDTQLVVTVTFDSDDPAEATDVRLIAADGATIQTGTTDRDGVVRFPRPADGTYRVIADAGAGHRKSATVMVAADTAPVPVEAPPDAMMRLGQISLGLLVIGLLVLAVRPFARKSP
jgi:hypothetical protein